MQRDCCVRSRSYSEFVVQLLYCSTTGLLLACLLGTNEWVGGWETNPMCGADIQLWKGCFSALAVQSDCAKLFTHPTNQQTDSSHKQLAAARHDTELSTQHEIAA